MLRLTIIIPIYNGATYLISTIADLEVFHKAHPFHEVIFVNDGSTDASLTILTDILAESLLPSTIHSYEQNKGKGSALALATKNAKPTDIIAFTDVELPYGLKKITEVITVFQIKSSTDVVIGKREQSQKDYTPYRLLYTKLFRLLLPQKVRRFTDTQCGFKFFRYHAAIALFSVIQTSNWVCDIELLLAATAQRKIIAEIPVQIKPSCKTRGSISIRTHGRQIINDIQYIKSHEKKGHYHTQQS